MTRLEYIRVYLAKWALLNICARLHANATVSLCMEVTRIYNEKHGNKE